MSKHERRELKKSAAMMRFLDGMLALLGRGRV